MAIRDLPDMYALSPQAPGLHIRKIPYGHVTTITKPPLWFAKHGTNISNHSKIR